MTRVDELQKKYPSIPRDVIVKFEMLGRGIKDTDDLDKLSFWGGPSPSYQSYDFDLTYADVVSNRPWREKPGRLMRPGETMLKRGLIMKTNRHTTSPYEIREAGGRFALYEEEGKITDLYRVPHRMPFEKVPLTSKGTPILRLITLFSNNCFIMVPLRYCVYFSLGDQCKFCNLNPSQEDFRSLASGRPVSVNLDEALEAYTILNSSMRLFEGRLESGAFTESEQEANLYLRFLEKLASAGSYTPVLTLMAQPMDRGDLQRLKDVGLHCFCLQKEVWDADLFAEVCPGKAKYRGHEQYLECLQDAVDIFGVGKVSCAFVAGVTMLPPNGHKTWQEARDSHVEGNTWMIEHGIVPTFTTLRVAPGSAYWEDEANRQKYPPSELYLAVIKAHDEAMSKNGLYEKMSKLMICPYDCISGGYGGEMGMLERGGDMAGWMSNVVPREFDWLADELESIRAQQ